jgi:general secretion pathway protein A
VRYHITPLSENEIPKYIAHRLAVAGCQNSINFEPEGFEFIHSYTKGVPRMINLVCDKALLLGYVLENKNITGEIIRKSINEIEGRIN